MNNSYVPTHWMGNIAQETRFKSHIGGALEETAQVGHHFGTEHLDGVASIAVVPDAVIGNKLSSFRFTVSNFVVFVVVSSRTA